MSAQSAEIVRGKRSGFRIQNKSLASSSRPESAQDVQQDRQADGDWAASVGRGGFQDSHVSSGESWGRTPTSNFHVERHGDYHEKNAEVFYQDMDNQVDLGHAAGGRRKQNRAPPQRNLQGMQQSEVPHAAVASAGRNQYAPKSQMQQPPLPPPPPPSSAASNRRVDSRQYQSGGSGGQHPGHSPGGQQGLQKDSQGFFQGHLGNRGPSRDGHAMQAVDVYGASAHPCMQRSYPQHNQQNAVQRDEQHQYSQQVMHSQPQKPRLPQEQHQGRMVRLEQQQQISLPHSAQNENGGADFCGIDPELLLQALSEKSQTHDVTASLHYFHRLAQLNSLAVSHFRIAASELNRLLRQVREDHMLTVRQLADLTYDLGTLSRFKNEPIVKDVMQLLSELTWQRREKLTPSACSSFVWGFACLLWREDRLMSVVAAAVVKKIESLDHRDLANTAWGFAKAGLWNQELGNCLFLECQVKIDTFSPQSLSSVAWAMAEWSFKTETLVDTITRAVLHKCSDFEPSQLSMTAWAFANLEISNSDLMTRFAETSRRKITRFTNAELAHLAWAFANLKIQDDEFVGLKSAEVKKGVKATPPKAPPPLRLLLNQLDTATDDAAFRARVSRFERSNSLDDLASAQLRKLPREAADRLMSEPQLANLTALRTRTLERLDHPNIGDFLARVEGFEETWKLKLETGTCAELRALPCKAIEQIISEPPCRCADMQRAHVSVRIKQLQAKDSPQVPRLARQVPEPVPHFPGPANAKVSDVGPKAVKPPLRMTTGSGASGSAAAPTNPPSSSSSSPSAPSSAAAGAKQSSVPRTPHQGMLMRIQAVIAQHKHTDQFKEDLNKFVKKYRLRSEVALALQMLSSSAAWGLMQAAGSGGAAYAHDASILYQVRQLHEQAADMIDQFMRLVKPSGAL